MKVLSFFVPGVPVPKGSGKAFYNKRTGKSFVRQDNAERQKPWASLISVQAQEEMHSTMAPMITGPVKLTLEFTMPRPKFHYGSGKNAAVLKPSAPMWHVSKPDLDKLIRCVKDALTGIVWVDDCQVCCMGEPTKVYGCYPGVQIVVEAL